MNSPFSDVVEEIQSIASMHFDYVEITIEKPRSSIEILSSSKQRILELTKSYGIRLLAHVPWSFELGPPYSVHLTSASEQYAQRIEKAVELAHEFGIDTISVHPPVLKRYSHAPEERRILRQYIIAAGELVSFAENLGCVICVENMDEESFSTEDLEELLSHVPGLGFTLDIGHANIGKLNDNRSTAYLMRFGERLRHIHISDNLGGFGDLHLPIGAGTIEFDKIFNVIRGMRYDGTMTVEVFAPDRTYLRISKDKIAEALRASI